MALYADVWAAGFQLGVHQGTDAAPDRPRPSHRCLLAGVAAAPDAGASWTARG